MFVPDNYSQWEEHERQAESWLSKRPVCCYCCEHIQDERYYEVEGELYHVDCFNDEHLKWTEEYIE